MSRNGWFKPWITPNRDLISKILLHLRVIPAWRVLRQQANKWLKRVKDITRKP